MQRTWVWSLGWEDSTYHGAIKPMHNNCWACTLEPVGHNKRSHWTENPMNCSERGAPSIGDQRKPTCTNEDPAQPLVVIIIINFKNLHCIDLSFGFVFGSMNRNRKCTYWQGFIQLNQVIPLVKLYFHLKPVLFPATCGKSYIKVHLQRHHHWEASPPSSPHQAVGSRGALSTLSFSRPLCIHSLP